MAHYVVLLYRLLLFLQEAIIKTALTLYVFFIELNLKQIQLLIHIICPKRTSTYLSDRLFDKSTSKEYAQILLQELYE